MLFISFSVSTTLFLHTYFVKGVFITHSHPFQLPDKNGPVNNHSHSTGEYILLQQFCETSVTDSIFNTPFIPDQLFAFCFEFNTTYTYFFSSQLTVKESPRAPPVC
jgi:hypothetical protein